MGTRSVTNVYEENGQKIISMYRQMDGYPTGMGQDLKDFLTGIIVVNGISMGEQRRIANGMGCLAAQLVAHFKTEPGGIYLYPPEPIVDAGQEYDYHVSYYRDHICLRVEGYEGNVIYDGVIEDCDMEKLERP